MKNKGFTLIELLAVILILGIIALIAIPTVNKIINQAKKGAFETTVSNLIDAVSDANSLEQLTDETLTKSYTITDGVISPSLDIKGKIADSGTLLVNDKGEVSLAIYNGKYCAEKGYTDTKITVSEKTIDNCIMPITVVAIHRNIGTMVNNACDPTGSTYPCLGEYLLFSFNYAPVGYLQANGQMLSIGSNAPLYSLFGTTYGGDGVTTFALPNLTSSAPIAGVNYYVTNQGSYPGDDSITPTTSAGFNYFTYETTYKNFLVGEIKLAANVNETNYNMLPCDGRTLQISQYPALFSLIGTIYGGNGMTTFMLPNMSSVPSPVSGMKYYIVTDSSAYPTRP